MLEIIVATSFSLFLLMDSVGNIPIYLSLLHKLELRRRQWVILREMVIALIIILLFAFFGIWLLRILGISHVAIHFAGGIVLFVMALKMIFPEKLSFADSFAIEGEPIVFPLAVPLIAGPSVLAAVVIYSIQVDHFIPLIISVFIAWLASTTILLASSYLQKWLGLKGILAIERLMGLILMLIAVNMFLEGVNVFLLSKKI